MEEVINHAVLRREWDMTATKQDKELYYTILDFEEEYFPEMTFKADSIISKFLEYEIVEDDGSFTKTYEEILSSIKYMNYRFYIKDIENYPYGQAIGQINSEERTLIIAPEFSTDKGTILHEMIHVYVDNINNNFHMFYHDIFTLCLYNDLKSKVPELDNRILSHTHVILGQKITMQGGSHDILFFLKSLDLDLRCGYKLGTICAYGRDEYIKASE